ncbi:MAG TPA: methyltransferase domain-containing protein [Steroidobacteraceae bacterium]|jgi:predicted SAM-dependent methyltransferase|nr:methyltransferase domain-containing protein [Steroidobacteraceae bacterium]
MDTVNDVPKPWNPLGLRKILGRYRAVRAGRDALNVLRVGGKRLRQGLDISMYLRTNRVRCLQIGAGPTSMPGWLRTDLSPILKGAVYLDASKRFPIPDESFDFIQSEHMIEHVPFVTGVAMIRECHRILKPGGRVRIATPDLARLVGLYGRENVGAAWRSIESIALGVYKNSECAKPIFAINSAMHDWGHQFLYDEETLRAALLAAGFVNVQRFHCNESPTERLRGVERHIGVSGDDEVNDFESLVLEAERP